MATESDVVFQRQRPRGLIAVDHEVTQSGLYNEETRRRIHVEVDMSGFDDYATMTAAVRAVIYAVTGQHVGRDEG